MSLELISILGNRDNHGRFASFITEQAVDSELYRIISELSTWYDKFPTLQEVDWNKFGQAFKLKHPKIDHSMYSRIFKRIAEQERIDDAYLEELMKGFIAKDYGLKASEIALKAAEDGEGIDELEELLNQYRKETGAVARLDDYEAADDIDSLMFDPDNTEGFNWKMKFLNQSLGMARKGQLILAAARPNSGKTTLLASEVTNWACQMEDDEVILWFNY